MLDIYLQIKYLYRCLYRVVAINQHHRDEGRLQIIKILLAQGARLESKNSSGWTPLLTASYCGHVDILLLLLNGGAEIDAKAEDGLTALTVAAQVNYAYHPSMTL